VAPVFSSDRAVLSIAADVDGSRHPAQHVLPLGGIVRAGEHRRTARLLQPTKDAENLLAVSQLLQRATILCGGFELCRDYVDARTFVYFDPPYRPISTTSSFTSYAADRFNDDQRRLAAFFAGLHATTGAKLMLSNSDPKNNDPGDGFFDDLYAGFTIRRVAASRMINSVAGRRGKITEILVTNY
jgi:DNA adenine methylase